MNHLVLSIFSMTLLVLLLVAGIVLTLFIAGKQRAQQEKLLAETKLDFERELRQVEAEVSEHVMAQFAHELHDNIGQLLTAMHLQIENQKIDHPVLAEGYKPIEIYLGEVSQQLRLLSKTLNNDFIGNSGLYEAIQLELNRLKNLRRFKVHMKDSSKTTYLDKQQELMVFRIFQEIMHNALRHSGAQNVYITLMTNPTAFELEIRDDGKGFDLEHMFESNKASGLRNILKRAKLARLECTMQSAIGKGTLFILKKMPT